MKATGWDHKSIARYMREQSTESDSIHAPVLELIAPSSARQTFSTEKSTKHKATQNQLSLLSPHPHPPPAPQSLPLLNPRRARSAAS